MNAQKTIIEADRILAVVEITAAPGDHLLVVNDVCIGVERRSGDMGNSPQPPFTTSFRRPFEEKSIQAKEFIDYLLMFLDELRIPIQRRGYWTRSNVALPPS